MIYLGIQVILFGIVLYKLSAMGLLPVSAADYVDLVPPFEVFLTLTSDYEGYSPCIPLIVCVPTLKKS